jgi:hypothetical protein
MEGTTGKDGLSPQGPLKLSYLFRRARVNPIENSRAERATLTVDGKDAGSNRTDAHPYDLFRVNATLLQQSATQGDEIVPPDILGVVLHPARPGQRKCMPHCGAGQNFAGGGDDHSL